MAFHVKLTARAIRNLKTLYSTIQAEYSPQSKTWFTGLEKAIFSLREHPGRCPVTPENARLRHLLYGTKPHTYRIIFTLDEHKQTVTVIQVRHGARRTLTTK